jgi:hypothetical protein
MPEVLDIEPRFCVTCGLYLNPDPSDQSWFWNGDHSGPQHFACRQGSGDLNARTRGDDDGREYGDPRDYRRE